MKFQQVIDNGDNNDNNIDGKLYNVKNAMKCYAPKCSQNKFIAKLQL